MKFKLIKLIYPYLVCFLCMVSREPLAMWLCFELAENLDQGGWTTSVKLCWATPDDVLRTTSPLPSELSGSGSQQPCVHPPCGAAGAQPSHCAPGGEPASLLPGLRLPSATGHLEESLSWQAPVITSRSGSGTRTQRGVLQAWAWRSGDSLAQHWRNQSWRRCRNPGAGPWGWGGWRAGQLWSRHGQRHALPQQCDSSSCRALRVWSLESWRRSQSYVSPGCQHVFVIIFIPFLAATERKLFCFLLI